MSVIFRTLKKLKTESSGAGKSTARREHRKKIIAFNAALRSPSSMLLFLIVFTILGAGSLFGYFQLRDKSGKKVEAFSISNIDMHQSTNISPDGKIENKGKKSLNSIEYQPPEANETRVDINGPHPSNIGEARVATIRKTTETSHIRSKTQAEHTSKSSKFKDSAAPDVRKVFFANAKKNAKIARLVADIRMEMDHGDKNRIKKLFDELAMIKGQNNSYVLKLKAVWHIQNQEYKDAADLLKEVLSKNELDLEAGLNMAIVEIKTRKVQNAYRRLEKLQKNYPDSIRLAEMLQDLRRLFDEVQLQHYSRHDG